MFRARLIVIPVVLVGVCSPAEESEWRAPEIVLPARQPGTPVFACTREELSRLRSAWAGEGPEHAVVAAVVRRADSALAGAVVFPPRGGQHNQWYQCDACETALQTVDDTHHKCPLCERVYSGQPYDDVIFARRHHQLLRGMHDAAWAYAITGEAKYAEFAALVLRGYAQRYSRYPLHGNTRWNLVWKWVAGGHLFEQTLSEASTLATRIAPAFDLVYDAACVTEADRKQISRGLILPMLKTVDKYKAGVVNWQTWHNAAMFTGGAAIGQVKWMRKAVHGESWFSVLGRTMSLVENVRERSLKRAGNGFLFQLEHSVTADGMWYENSWGYHFYALHALVIQAEAARRVGVDLWSHPRLKPMFTLPAFYTMPDGSLPRFADDVGTRATGRAALMTPAYAAYRDTALLPLLPSKPDWDTVLYGGTVARRALPALTSRVFEGAGHAVLRSGGEGGLTTAVTFGRHGGYHGHFDKLSFVLFAFGAELGVDPGRAKSQAYRLPIHRNWYKATLSHNTVLVDGRSQKGATGELEFFGVNQGISALGVRCDTAYRGVRQRRLFVQTATELLVVDQLDADRSRRFDWVYHSRGLGVVCPAAQAASPSAGSFRGAEYIRDARTGATGETVRIAFEGKAVTTHLALAGEAGTSVWVGDGVGATVSERIPMCMVSKSGRRAQFVAVLEPVPAGECSRIRDVCVQDSNGALVVGIVRDGRTDTVHLSDGVVVSVSGEPVTVVSGSAGASTEKDGNRR